MTKNITTDSEALKTLHDISTATNNKTAFLDINNENLIAYSSDKETRVHWAYGFKNMPNSDRTSFNFSDEDLATMARLYASSNEVSVSTAVNEEGTNQIRLSSDGVTFTRDMHKPLRINDFSKFRLPETRGVEVNCEKLYRAIITCSKYCGEKYYRFDSIYISTHAGKLYVFSTNNIILDIHEICSVHKNLDIHCGIEKKLLTKIARKLRVHKTVKLYSDGGYLVITAGELLIRLNSDKRFEKILGGFINIKPPNKLTIDKNKAVKFLKAIPNNRVAFRVAGDTMRIVGKQGNGEVGATIPCKTVLSKDASAKINLAFYRESFNSILKSISNEDVTINYKDYKSAVTIVYGKRKILIQPIRFEEV